jgi:phage protein D
MPDTSLLAHFYVKLGGSDAPEELMQDLGNVEVDDSLHLPDMFTIKVRDPHLTWADSPLLKIGQEVEILARSAGPGQPEPKRLLVGEITSVEPDYPYGSAPVVMLRGYDRAHRLHRGQKTRSFVQMTDSDIVTKITREYGLKPEVDDTTEVYAYILQNNLSDFEFVMERARRLGFTFLVDDRSLVFKKPGSLSSDTVELEYGVTLRQFKPRMTTASQFKEVIVKGWDTVNKRDILGHAGASTPGGANGSGGPLGGLADAASGAAGGALGDAAGAASSQLNSLAGEAMGFASGKAAGAVQKAKSQALGALPEAARGPAAQLAEAGLQKGLELASQYLGADAASAVGAVASGDSAAVAQVGMELGAKVVEKAFGEAGVLVVTQHPVRSQSEADQLAKSIFDELTSGNLQAEGVASGNAALTAGCKVKLTALGNKFSGEYFVSHTRHTYDPEDGYLTEFSISGRNPDTFTDLLTGGAGTNPGTNGNNGPAGVVVGLVTNNQDPDGQGRVKVKFPWLPDSQESNWARLAMPMAGNGRGLFLLPEVNDEVLVVFEHGDINHPYVIGALWSGTDQPPISASQAVNGNGEVVQRVFKTRAGHTILFDDSDDSPGIQIIDKTGNNKIIIDSKDNKLIVELDGDVSLKSKGKIDVEAQTDMNFRANGSMSLKAASGIQIEADASVKVKGATVELN